MRLPSSNGILVSTLALALVSTGLLVYWNKMELLPQAWVSVLTAVVGYLAFFYTREKLRLDLFDKRFAIYEKTLDYCSYMLAHASLEPTEANRAELQQALAAAGESFRGIGYHKSRALFGEDIAEIFRELNESFSFIVAFGPERAQARLNAQQIEEYWRHVRRTVDLSQKLPEVFKPYMYFGDI